jgi:hypothetical protein
MSRRADRRPIHVVPLDREPETRYLRVVEPTPMAHPVAQSLDSLGRMPPRTAITLIVSTAGVVAGTVITALALVGIVAMALAAITGMVAIAALCVMVATLVLGGRSK